MFSTAQNFQKRIRAQRGISLPLLALFIGIASIFVIVAIIYGTRYFQQAKAQNEITALSDLKVNVVSYGSRVGVFTNDNTTAAVLIGQGLFPLGLVNGTTISNQWGGTVTPAMGTLASAGDSISFDTTSIPGAACRIIGTSLDDVAGRIEINGTLTKALGARTNPADVNTACSNENNTMTLVVGR